MYNTIVNSVFNRSLIALTYKGKILLTHQDPIPPTTVFKQKIWSFIETEKAENESFEETLCKKVIKEASIGLNNVEFVSTASLDNQIIRFYHAQLTDKNVNEINRGEGQLLDFFSLKELKSIMLRDSTRLFVKNHKDIFEKASE